MRSKSFSVALQSGQTAVIKRSSSSGTRRGLEMTVISRTKSGATARGLIWAHFSRTCARCATWLRRGVRSTLRGVFGLRAVSLGLIFALAACGEAATTQLLPVVHRDGGPGGDDRIDFPDVPDFDFGF